MPHATCQQTFQNHCELLALCCPMHLLYSSRSMLCMGTSTRHDFASPRSAKFEMLKEAKQFRSSSSVIKKNANSLAHGKQDYVPIKPQRAVPRCPQPCALPITVPNPKTVFKQGAGLLSASRTCQNVGTTAMNVNFTLVLNPKCACTGLDMQAPTEALCRSEMLRQCWDMLGF